MRTFGRYELLSPIASGGMAEVWRASVAGPAGVRKEVALKLLRGEHAASGDFARMLVEEARLAARLTHANVVQVFELVEEGGRHAIAMELVRGRDLGRVLERCRERGVRLGLARAVHLGAEVARGLDYAHRALGDDGRPLGLVHRDVSPHNVLLSFEGEVKLADFGIARAESHAGLTAPGTVKGKLAWMAPEQAAGRPVDARADVFALGVLLWELCAGRRLFAREGEAATLAALLGDEPISPPSHWNEAVPPALDAVVLGALERDPERRTASAGALAAALAELRHRLAASPEALDLGALLRELWPEGEGSAVPVEATQVRPSAPPTGSGTEARETVTLAAKGRGERRRWLAAGVVAMVAVVAVAGWIAAQHGTPASSPPATPVSTSTSRPNPTAAAAPEAPGLTSDPELDPAAAARGEGIVAVRVHPWATVAVDGAVIGETPQDLKLAAGRHRVRASHPTLGAAELDALVEPGRRVTWRPALAK